MPPRRRTRFCGLLDGRATLLSFCCNRAVVEPLRGRDVVRLVGACRPSVTYDRRRGVAIR
jgi:hypothetical protein